MLKKTRINVVMAVDAVGSSAVGLPLTGIEARPLGTRPVS